LPQADLSQQSGGDEGGGTGGNSGFELLFCRAQCNQFPRRAVFQKTRDQRGVHGVSGALGYDVAKNVVAGESEVADEVEDLVANELVVKAQRAVGDALAIQDDGISFGDTADQTHVAQLLFVLLEAEGAGGSDLRAIVAGSEINDKALAADGRGEVDLVGDAVAFAGIDTNELVAIVDLDSLADTEVFAAAALGLEADVTEGFDVRQGTAVEDGKLEVVELHDDVVDAGSDEGREQVFGGGDKHALAHKAGGVANLGDIASGGGDLEVVEVGAAKENAAAAGGREQAHVNGRSAVQADA